MVVYRVILASLLVAVLLVHQTVAGPAHTLALTMAAHSANKIPRTIRAPFRNTEIMTARGFGKRAENLMNLPSPSSSENFPENDLFPLGLSMEEDDERRQRVPINFIVSELQSNPGLLRQFIRRFVDANNDGMISQQELMMGRLD